MYNKALKNLCITFFVICLMFGAVLCVKARPLTPAIGVMRIEGAIVPVVAEYICRSIKQAEDNGSTAVIIELDTPGGLVDTTKNIVVRILNADVPVIVYISPAGASADSAGTFIALSAHIAAMAPGTRIGAATPITMGGEVPDETQQKMTEATAAWMRSIAEQRSRDVQYAELAVTEGKSYTDSEALKNGLIDIKADDLHDLISKIDGMEVILANGEKVTLNLEGALLNKVEMDLMERLLHTISNPNIALILMSIGMIGIMVEIYNPGAIVPGVIGSICLLLAFYSLNMLDAFWGGIALIVLAFALFIAEMFTPVFGIFTAGGLVAFVFGALILFSSDVHGFEVSSWLIGMLAVLLAAFFGFVVQRLIKAHRDQPVSGKEGLVGKTAVVKTAMDPEGMVFIDGELWLAVSEGERIEEGEKVVVINVDGLKLKVVKFKKEGGE